MRALLCCLILVPLLAGCARDIASDSYSAQSVGESGRAVRAEVVSVRPVSVEGTKGIGTLAGAGAGGVAGSALGTGSRGDILGAIGGALVGGILGAVTEDSLTSQSGWEYVVQTADGGLVTLVQGGEPLAEGQKVILLYGERARLIPDTTPDTTKA